MDKNNKKQGLLQKKISELTEKDLLSLKIELGKAKRPYPMFGTTVVDEDGQQSMEQSLESIHSDKHPMKIYSERSYAEVIGLTYRDMPTPSMLPMLKKSLEMLEPENKNRVYFMKGDPGAGKSFLGGSIIGKAQSIDRPVKIHDCGGRNMNDSLFEMILDFGSGDTLYDAIDTALEYGAIKKHSLGILASHLGDAFQEDKNGKVSIDWEDVIKGDIDVPAKEDFSDEKAYSEARVKFYKQDNVKSRLDDITKALLEVAKLNGLEQQANALGMNTQFGFGITDFIEGNFSVWDEYNKSKEGGDNQLQTVLQFFNGEIDECTVTNTLKNKDETSGPSEFTFRREDVKLGWGVILTGNANDDGTTTRPMNQSVYSRLTMDTIPKPSHLDWQHRICQIMTGLPISTLHSTYRDFIDENKPEEFGEMLMKWRTAGLTDDEKNNIPQIQISFIKNWPKVLEATDKLAEFYAGWAGLVDPENAFTKDGLVEEVDEEYQKEASIDFRKVIQHIGYAMTIRPRMESNSALNSVDMSPDNWDIEPEKHVETEPESLERNFGTRITDLLADKIYETSGAIGKPYLYAELQALMKACGLKDLHLQEAANSKVKSVESNLNISLFEMTDLSQQIELAQEMFCDHIRSDNPEITADNDSIITISQMRDVLAGLEKQAEDDKDLSFSVPNTDPETLHAEPFISAEVWDMSNEEMSKRDFSNDDLVDHDALMMTLAFPKAGDKNLKAAWDKEHNLSLLILQSNSIDKQTTLESEVDQLENDLQSYIQIGNAEDNKLLEKETAISEKQKEILDLLQNTSRQLKHFGSQDDAVEKQIDELKRELLDKNVALEDDVSIGLPLNGSNVIQDDGVQIAENSSDTGIGTTSIVVKAANENGDTIPVPVHIIVNNNSQKTLVVSGKVSTRLSTLFREVGILHVNRDAKDAKSTLRDAVDDILRGVSDDTRDNIKSSLLYRNDPVGVEDHEIDDKNDASTLEDILLSYQPYLGKYLVANKKQPPIKF